MPYAFQVFAALLTWNLACDAVSKVKRSTGSRSIPLTDTQKMEILTMHNDYRRSSGSSNMRYMTWDSQLEWIAEQYGRTCQYKHNENRQHSKYRSVGENIYATNMNPSQFTPPTAVRMWYEEVADFNYQTRACGGKSCGHYTQMVWATSFKLGCALTACDYLSEIKMEDGLLFICNYATSGNTVNPRNKKLYQIFEKGPACSKCAKDDYCRDSLCANSKRDFVEMPLPMESDDSKLGLIVAVVVLSIIVVALIVYIVFRERKTMFYRRRDKESRHTAVATSNVQTSVTSSAGEPTRDTVPKSEVVSSENSYVTESLLADENRDVPQSHNATTRPETQRKTALVRPRMPPPSVPAPILVKRVG